MNILILGSGGREHTLAWKIKQSPLCENLFIAPGNAGTAACGTNLSLGINDFDSIAEACRQHDIDMLLVGPEEPLVNGIYDFFKSKAEFENLKVIGPSKHAAQLEGSKSFAKDFMGRNNIPTAAYREFQLQDIEAGINYLKQHAYPVVLKADGLAAGKGVLICGKVDEAEKGLREMLEENKFGKAGSKVVIEEFLTGIELSVFVITDGVNYKLLPEAKDYKRIGEGDTGLNTGGMGAVSPVPFADEAFMHKVIEQVIKPTIAGLQKDELEYYGFIFFGLINCDGEPKIIEYNCRLGDPETEVVIPRIKNDLVEILIAANENRLHEIVLETDLRAAATVVAVSGGYPEDYSKGKVINGLPAGDPENTLVFHSGTKKDPDKVVTNGGRVLAVTSYGNNIIEAVVRSKQILSTINFEGMYFRKDIGYEF